MSVAAWTGLRNGIPRRQDPKSPRAPWENVGCVPQSLSRETRAALVPQMAQRLVVNRQELSNELAAEEPWLPVSRGALKHLISFSPTCRGAEQDRDVTQQGRGRQELAQASWNALLAHTSDLEIHPPNLCPVTSFTVTQSCVTPRRRLPQPWTGGWCW